MRARPLTDAEKLRIRTMRGQGMLVKNIAWHMNLNKSTVYRAIRSERKMGKEQEATIYDQWGPCQP